MDKDPIHLSPIKSSTGPMSNQGSSRALLAAGLLLCGLPIAAQERFLPSAATVVLASSVHASGATAGSLRALDQAWRAQPQDLSAAVAYARAVFTLGFSEGDLRWFGSAKAAMAPWWQAKELTADGFFMRGLVKQGFHDFAGGLQDIQQAIGLQAQRAEFWSWRFALHLLLADMRAAEQDAQEIDRLFGPAEAQIYRAVLHYRTGQASAAVKLLRESMRAAEHQGASSQVWIGFHLGEALRVAAQPEQAINVWQQSLQAQPKAHLLRLSLAELLNQQGRFKEAKAVATGPANKATSSLTDALLVQALLASRGLKSADETLLAGQMQARLQSQALRQEALIERPKLIYQIAYGHDMAAGLALSVENWQLQKEPPDALLFAQAALALKQARVAEPVVNWAQATGYTEPALRELIGQLTAHPSWSKEGP